MAHRVVTRGVALVDDYLLVWVLLSVGVGVAVPSMAILTPLTTPILAVMIGAVSLTLAPERFRRLRGRALVAILVVQTGMAVFGFAVARGLGLSPALTAGFVILGAVTPELVTPTMTELGGGDTALATVVLVAAGVETLVVVPTAVTLFVGRSVAVDPVAIVEQLALAVVLPMGIAVGCRFRWPDRIGAYDDVYPSVSGLMVILVIGIVTAANASLIRNGARSSRSSPSARSCSTAAGTPPGGSWVGGSPPRSASRRCCRWGCGISPSPPRSSSARGSRPRPRSPRSCSVSSR